MALGFRGLEGLSLLPQLNAARLPRREREATRRLTLLFMRLFIRALAVFGVVQKLMARLPLASYARSRRGSMRGHCSAVRQRAAPGLKRRMREEFARVCPT